MTPAAISSSDGMQVPSLVSLQGIGAEQRALQLRKRPHVEDLPVRRDGGGVEGPGRWRERAEGESVSLLSEKRFRQAHGSRRAEGVSTIRLVTAWNGDWQQQCMDWRLDWGLWILKQTGFHTRDLFLNYIVCILQSGH